MFTVQILGSSSATPAFARYPSSQVLAYNDRYYLIDCGEGTQMQLQKYKIKISRMDAIFISHLHGDHILGLPGFLSSVSIYERSRPFPLFAPAGMKEIIDLVFKYSDIELRYELQFHALEDYSDGELIFTDGKFQVKSFHLSHRSFCRGFLFEENNKFSKFDFYKAKELGIPGNLFPQLKEGKSVTLPDGSAVDPEQVLISPKPPLSYAYCSDTIFDRGLPDRIRGVNTLYHEATFLDELKIRATQTHHSTAKEAGQIAAMAEAKKLLIGHFSARYGDLDMHLLEARSEFPQTELATEGKTFAIENDA